MKIQDITEMIGNTPLLKVNDKIEYYAKIEGDNFFGSVKDRAAKYLMESAYKEGIIKRDTVIVESSSGNFGIALAGMKIHIGRSNMRISMFGRYIFLGGGGRIV